jgi:hypothetical protein
MWLFLLAACSSDWSAPDVTASDPEAPSILTACAAGGVVADGEIAGVLCTSPPDLLTAPVEHVEPGPIVQLAP